MEETSKALVVKRKSCGRRKIEIKKIEDKSKRQVTFSKRKKGLITKAAELSVLCGVDVALLLKSPGGKVFTFGCRASADDIIARYVAEREAISSAGHDSSATACNALANQLQNHMHLQEEEEKEYGDILKMIEIEKAKAESLKQNKAAAGATDSANGEFWWEQPVDNLNLDELMEYKSALEALRKNVLDRADQMAATEAASNNNTVLIPSAAAVDVAAYDHDPNIASGGW